jgi:hypothetical protein
MGFKIQYNQSTNKIHFAATNKVQVVDDGGITPGDTCNHCGAFITPKFVKVTFSGVTQIGDSTCYSCPVGVGACKDHSYSGTFDINTSYILEQTSFDPCVYGLDVATSVVRTRWNSNDGSCSLGILDQVTLTTLGIGLVIAGTSLDLTTSLFNASLTAGGAHFQGIDTRDGTDCVAGTVVNNVISGPVGCPNSVICATGTLRLGYGGTATIEVSP